MNLLLCFGFVTSKDNNAAANSFTTEKSSGSSEGGSSQSGESSQKNAEFMGTAVFKSDKLVGELSYEETLYHLLIRNQFESCYISLPNFESQQKPLDLYIFNKKSPRIKVELINGTPLIHLNLNLDAKILSSDNTLVDMSEERLQQISNSASQYIKSKVEQHLYRTSTEFQSDIVGFGKYALKHFSTTQDFEKYNWTENYRNSFFNVTVNTNVRSAFLLSGK